MAKWPAHFRILGVMALIAAPLFVLDYALLGPGKGGWISLDFRGVLIGAYALWLAAHALVSTGVLAVVNPATRLGRLHTLVGIVTAIGLGVGTYVVASLQDAKSAREYTKRRDERASFAKNFTLDRWSVDVDIDKHPTAVHFAAHTAVACDVAARVTVYNDQDSAPWRYEDESGSRRPVQANAQVRWDFKITPPAADAGNSLIYDHVEIHLMFFDCQGSGTKGLSIIYKPSPESDDDGHFLYRPLPPPTP